MKLSPLKFALATSLVVHGTIFSAYTVWNGKLSNERFAPSEARMAEIVIELEHTDSVSESTPAVVNPTPAVEPVETMTAPPDVSSLLAEPVDLIPVEQLVPSPAVSSPVQSASLASSESVSASEAPANSAPPANSVPAFVDGQAGYLICPKPAYPREARRRRQEGLVLLSASVSAEGLPEVVLIKQSSGADILDNAALETVRRWQFAPALVRSKAASSQVEIPIRFRLSK